MNPSEQIDKFIAQQDDWKSEIIEFVREQIKSADPQIEEEWKWSTPVWTHSAMVCAVGVFKEHMKINFFKGASLPDPHGLFNSGLDAKTSRAIDITEKDTLDKDGFKNLVKAAVDLNTKK
jgi:hypothetical protein